MKKQISAIAAVTCVAMTALTLSGCASPGVKFRGPAELKRASEELTETSKPSGPRSIARTNDSGPIDTYDKPVIFGVRRRFAPKHYGKYEVAYVRFPQDEKRDDTLDYSLTLNADDTFSLTVITDGVTAEHYGHYYIHYGGNIILYYDEVTPPTAHNVYVCDSLYGEMLPDGKIIFYDNCNMIVMTKSDASESLTDTEETNMYYYDNGYGVQIGRIALYSAR